MGTVFRTFMRDRGCIFARDTARKTVVIEWTRSFRPRRPGRVLTHFRRGLRCIRTWSFHSPSNASAELSRGLKELIFPGDNGVIEMSQVDDGRSGQLRLFFHGANGDSVAVARTSGVMTTTSEKLERARYIGRCSLADRSTEIQPSTGTKRADGCSFCFSISVSVRSAYCALVTKRRCFLGSPNSL